MKPQDKKYILENMDKKSIKELARDLGLRERRVRKFIEAEGPKKTEPRRPGGAEGAPAAAQGATTAIPRVRFSYALLVVIVLTGLIALIYSNTLRSEFYFDDYGSITRNISIRNLGDIGAIWNFWPTRFITYFSFALNYHFGRLDVFGYHLFNLLIHLGSALFVWWLALLTLHTPAMKSERVSSHANTIAFWAGLIFAVHPVQTQGINYIVQRAASLAALFYLVSVSMYVKARLIQYERPADIRSGIFYLGALLAAVMSMFSKETTVTLPFMVLIYEFSFLKTEKKINWKYVIPFCFTILIIPLVMLMTKTVNLAGMHLKANPAPGISAGHYLLTQFRVMVTYIRLLFIPVNQNLDYDYPVAQTFWAMPILASFAFLALIIFLAVRVRSKYRLISFAIFWFFLTLLPESSVIPIMDVIFEHRLYLPMFGYGLFLVGVMYYFFKGKYPRPIAAILLILVAGYSIMTYKRNFIWKDKFTLWDDAIRKGPDKARPYNDRGNAYADKGELDLAIADFNKSIELNPSDSKPYNNRGIAYEKKGEFDLAIADYDKAIELDPKTADIYNNRGNTYAAKGELDKAIADFNKSIELNPHDPKAYNNRGIAYGRKGELDKAISDFNKVIAMEPKYVDIYNNRGNAYGIKGEYEKALADYRRALEINPDDGKVYSNIANTYFSMKEYKKSLDNARQAEALGYKMRPEFMQGLTEALGKEK